MKHSPFSGSSIARGVVAVAVAVCSLVQPLKGGDGEWTPIGPDGAHIVAMAADPHSGRTFVGTEYAGVYASDSGSRWIDISEGLAERRVVALSVVPGAPSMLYVTTRSGLVFRRPVGEGPWRQLSVPRLPYTTAVVADATQNVLYITTSSPVVGSTAYVVRSTDGGTNWTRLGALGGLRFLLVSAGRLFAFTNAGALVSDDKGSTWSRVPGPTMLASKGATDGGRRLFVEANLQNILVSDDAGRTWRELPRAWRELSRPSDGCTDRLSACVPLYPTALTAARSGLLYMATSNGTFLYDGGGWSRLDEPALESFVTSLVVDGNEALLAGTTAGVFQLDEATRSWVARDEGLPGAVVRDLAIAPLTSGALFAATSRGLFRTTDDGGTWNTVMAGPGGAFQVEVSQSQPDIVYTSIFDGIATSTDSGATWTTVKPSPGASAETSVLAVASSDPATLYAAFVDGMQKTTDGGSSWSSVSNGLDLFYGFFSFSSDDAVSVAVHPADPSTALVTTFGGIYRTDDGGQRWGSALGEGKRPLAFDPANPSVVYAGGRFGGILKSNDAGRTWETLALLDHQDVYAIAVSAADSSIYAGTSFGRMYASRDGGATWTRFDNGLRAAPVLGIEVDRSGTTLYAATAAGVFHYRTVGVAVQRLGDAGPMLPDILDQVLAAPAAAAFVIPIAGSVAGAGGTRFTTDVDLTNRSGSPQKIFMAWLPAGRGGSSLFEMILPPAPGGRVPLLNFAEQLGSSGIGSILVVAVDETGQIDVHGDIDGQARIWAVRSGQPSSSQIVPAARHDLFGNGGPVSAEGLRHDATSRTNVGIVNLGDAARDFAVTVEGEHNRSEFIVSTGPWSLAHVALPPASYGALRISILAAPEARFVAYGTVTNNTTGEGATRIATR